MDHVDAVSPLSRRHRLWRCLPVRARRQILGGISEMLAPVPDATAPQRSSGITVAGEFARVCGLSEAARLTVAGLAYLGHAPGTLEVSWRGACPMPPPPGQPLIVHINAPDMAAALFRLGRATARGRRIVGAWAWELPAPDPAWQAGADYVHEIWAPSRFAAAALDKLAPGRVRVVTPPLAVAPPCPAALDRAAFGLPAEAVIVLTAFDLASSYTRKNPLAAVAAFRAAFGERTDRLLLLKIANPHHFAADFAQLRAEIGTSKNIHVFTATLPAATHHALMACADIVLSLHRSEGFGLLLAEAMLLGIPVIATDWSGNLDFMDADCAALIRPRLIQAVDPRGVYAVPGAVWAQPSLGEATHALRVLADDPIRRHDLGAKGRQHAKLRLGPNSLAAAMAALV